MVYTSTLLLLFLHQVIALTLWTSLAAPHVSTCGCLCKVFVPHWSIRASNSFESAAKSLFTQILLSLGLRPTQFPLCWSDFTPAPLCSMLRVPLTPGTHTAARPSLPVFNL